MKKMLESFLDPQRILLIGGIMTVIGGALTIYGSHLSSLQSAEADKKLLETQLNIQTKLTGGDTYCVVDVQQLANYRDGRPMFVVYLHGKTALKNVVITIENYGKHQQDLIDLNIDGNSNAELELWTENRHTFHYPAIYPNSRFTDIKLPINPNQTDLIYMVHIDTDSGHTDEIIDIKNYKSNNKVCKYKITSGERILVDTDMYFEAYYTFIENSM